MKNQSSGGFLIARIHHLADRLFTQKLKEYGITDLNPGQGRIMFALWQTNGMSAQELGKATSLGKSTLTSMLDRLEAAGHIQRQNDPQDRRSVLIFARDMTVAEKEQYTSVSQEMTDIFYSGLKKDEIAAFESTLRRVLANLDPGAV
ncbi:MAG: MarR family winged helix-turn-helix transcriptional regulator [Acidobacteriota bacterium]